MKHTLLIVDDNDSILKLLKAIFERRYNILSASDGVEAISFLYQSIKPDLIICDLNVHNINGYELVRHLSTSSLYNKIPVIILSNSAEPNIDFFRQQSIVKHIVKKPFDPVGLLDMVEGALLEKDLLKKENHKSEIRKNHYTKGRVY